MSVLKSGKSRSELTEPRLSARAKAARLRKEDIKRERHRQRLMTGAIVGVAAVIGGGLILLAVMNQPANRSAQELSDLAPVSGLGAESRPPWPSPTDVPARAEAAGLLLGPMGQAEHYHPELDVLVNGEPVDVPEGIGIDPQSGAMSALHTHSADGVIHVEASRTGQPFTLGQLFTEWNVRLTSQQVGALKAGDGNALRVYVDGDRVSGDPAMIRLEPEQKIVVVYGPADEEVELPASDES